MSQDTSNNEKPTHMYVEIQGSDGENDIFGPVSFDEVGKDIVFWYMSTYREGFTIGDIYEAIDLVMNGEEYAVIRLNGDEYYANLRLHKEYDQRVADALVGPGLSKFYLVRESQICANTPVVKKDTIVETLLPWLKEGKIPGRIEGNTYTFLDLEEAKEKAEAILNNATKGTDLKPLPGTLLKKPSDFEPYHEFLVGAIANEQGRVVRVVALTEVDASKTEGKQIRQLI